MQEARTFRGKGRWLLLAALVTAADLWSKATVFTPLVEYERRWVVGEWLAFTKVWNDGMMWGALQGWGWLLLPVRMAAAALVVWMLRTTAVRARLLLFSLGLVLGGALGNIYDGFAFDGRVRDFILVQFRGVPLLDPFPVFNVADSAICIGVGLLALGLLTEGRATRSVEAAPGE